MSILAAIVLALVAGITEIFPVSGTGHLYLFAKLLGVRSAEAEFQSFRAMLYFGVALGGCLFYHTQIGDIVRENLVLLGLKRPANRLRGEPFGRRLGLLLLLANIPMLPALLLNGLRLRVEQDAYTLAVISVLLVFSGTLLYFAARSARGRRSIHDMTLSDALIAGTAQILTIFPGLSRSGFTVGVLLNRGLEGPAAVEFTGLLGIPAFIAAGIFSLFSAGSAEGTAAAAPFLILGFSLSALSGFFTLRFFTDLMARRRPTGFSYWSWGAAILSLILFLISA